MYPPALLKLSTLPSTSRDARAVIVASVVIAQPIMHTKPKYPKVLFMTGVGVEQRSRLGLFILSLSLHMKAPKGGGGVVRRRALDTNVTLALHFTCHRQRCHRDFLLRIQRVGRSVVEDVFSHKFAPSLLGRRKVTRRMTLRWGCA